MELEVLVWPSAATGAAELGPGIHWQFLVLGLNLRPASGRAGAGWHRSRPPATRAAGGGGLARCQPSSRLSNPHSCWRPARGYTAHREGRPSTRAEGPRLHAKHAQRRGARRRAAGGRRTRVAGHHKGPLGGALHVAGPGLVVQGVHARLLVLLQTDRGRNIKEMKGWIEGGR